jgi:hypothetical protein
VPKTKPFSKPFVP